MPQNELTSKVGALNDWYRLNSAVTVLTRALTDESAGKMALVSSFGAESVVLLHMVSIINRDTPVLFVDTELLFAETLVYQQELSERLGLRNLHIIRASKEDTRAQDPDFMLNQRDKNACCALRKTIPLQKALEGFDGWITGRKRYQSSTRAELDFFEVEDNTGRMKINPLAHWRPEDVRTYMEENRLPRHPLVAQGYPSIGCMPCTTPVAEGEDPRAGRWRGEDKTECGIHFVDGKMVRTGENA
ncbi:Phosphoadenosine phosphosulfate reductase [Roseovarius albus]|uniref:Adenosine 5'-phosphosulfate reductase n=1 Tax=Roseovarius albus TaxID=1247867 RepID=A0A1X6Y9R0_9RHOB|nr:phosphoadenylyl-sulfate reductase [Roseovarius albus]SLN14498.1 Phosphoadenosine phosphosulfate reductase [Roseovarius albus]